MNSRQRLCLNQAIDWNRIKQVWKPFIQDPTLFCWSTSSRRRKSRLPPQTPSDLLAKRLQERLQRPEEYAASICCCRAYPGDPRSLDLARFSLLFGFERLCRLAPCFFSPFFHMCIFFVLKDFLVLICVQEGWVWHFVFWWFNGDSWRFCYLFFSDALFGFVAVWESVVLHLNCFAFEDKNIPLFFCSTNHSSTGFACVIAPNL